MSTMHDKPGRFKSRSMKDSRIAPGELLVMDSVTPSRSSQCREPKLSPDEILDSCLHIKDIEKSPHVAWWRGLCAFSGGTIRDKKPKKSPSRHTAWARYVCPVKASARRTGSTQIPLTASRGSQCKKQAQQALLPSPDISFFDFNRVILRGSDSEKEEQRRSDLQQQRRLLADKARKVQVSQCALRQKHDSWLKNKPICKGKGLASEDSHDAAVMAGISRDSDGQLYSLRESESESKVMQVSQNEKDISKDSGRVSSMSAETDAPTITEVQDLEEEYALASLTSSSPEPHGDDA